LLFYIDSKTPHLITNSDYIKKDILTIVPLLSSKYKVMAANSHYGSDPNYHPDQEELSNIMSKLYCGSDGTATIVMGTDGVLRSMETNRDIVDAIGLPTRLIKAYLDRFAFDQETEDMFRGADGTKVPQEQWRSPDPSLLPPPLTAEEKAWVQKSNEENKEIIQENKKKM
jgi:hypothetical protein